ncbi:acyloxyacyl hydrolase [Roseobacter weihaiensis]|uniref:acyloxyacyl hydrolase n=1 Tax=Roseobacter weihaiensis TaxID=2763262 RepID=UPI001D0B0F26|nr:acyloxyacyl hydrolase [Roseobacter sp. H9]
MTTKERLASDQGTSARLIGKRVFFLLIGVFALAMIAAVPQATASDLILGIGQDNIDSDQSSATTLQVEYHANPLREYTWGQVSPLAVIDIDSDGDGYAGIGLAALWNTSEKWFVEGSVAAGYYDRGSDGVNLGGNLQFRTLVGFGFRTSVSSRVSVAVDHLSNAGLNDINPGRNAITVRYARSF